MPESTINPVQRHLANGCEIGYLVTVEPVDMDLQQAKATTEEVRGELSVV
jgi:hypothetical protein